MLAIWFEASNLIIDSYSHLCRGDFGGFQNRLGTKSVPSPSCNLTQDSVSRCRRILLHVSAIWFLRFVGHWPLLWGATPVYAREVSLMIIFVYLCTHTLQTLCLSEPMAIIHLSHTFPRRHASHRFYSSVWSKKFAS